MVVEPWVMFEVGGARALSDRKLGGVIVVQWAYESQAQPF